MKPGLILIAAVVLGGCAIQRPQSGYAAANRRLDAARAGITPPLGATTYGLDQQRLIDQPGGENQSLAGSLAQLPGVSIAPGSGISVRGR